LGNLFFAAGVGEVDTALLHAVEDGADQMRQAERRRHVGVELERSLPEVIDVSRRQAEGLQLVQRAASSCLCRWNQVHSDTAPVKE